jgi:hypothetical protein
MGCDDLGCGGIGVRPFWARKTTNLLARRHRRFGEHRYVVLAYMRRRRLRRDNIVSEFLRFVGFCQA